MIFTTLSILATIVVFVWLAFTHPVIAAVWFVLAFILTLFFAACVDTVAEGEAE